MTSSVEHLSQFRTKKLQDIKGVIDGNLTSIKVLVLQANNLSEILETVEGISDDNREKLEENKAAVFASLEKLFKNTETLFSAYKDIFKH